VGRSGDFFRPLIGFGRKLIVVNRVIEQPRFRCLGRHGLGDMAVSRGLRPTRGEASNLITWQEERKCVSFAIRRDAGD
jgi:hypothetical protein